jgi:hypothetical protein
MNITITDGANRWRTDITGIPFGVGGYGKAIAYSPTKIVVGGMSGPIAVQADRRSNICYSDASDGINWIDASGTPIGSPFGRNADSGTVAMCNDILYKPAYGLSPGIFIAVGKGRSANANICYSSNGMFWTDISSNPFYGGQGNSITYNPAGPIFVTGGSGETTILYSSDGMRWLAAIGNPFGVSGACNKVTYIPDTNQFFAVGHGSNGRANICFSTNGNQWTDVSGSPFGSGYGMDITYNPPTKRFIASGKGIGRSNVCYSSDGVMWKDVVPGIDGKIINPFGSTGVGNAIAYDSASDTLVVVGADASGTSSIYYS